MPQVRANGIDIEYESFGRESDPAILLIMGFSAQLTLWPAPLCEGLAGRGFRTIRFDNRDIGKSTHLMDRGAPNLGALMAAAAQGQPVEAPYTLDDMADDAAALLDALRIDSAHIVGASMGGMIAQLVAIRHPARTRSLVSIMSTTGRRDLPPATPEAMAALMTPPASSRREDRIAASVRTWRAIGSPGFAATDEELHADAVLNVDRVPYEPAGIARQFAAIIASPPRHEMLAAVRAPALVIHGADDPLVRVEGGRDTAASIPACELAIVPGMGHDFTRTLTPVLERHIGSFVEKVERRAAA
jgi:pimeloyl-ACP methyl ester carboxylesterase